MKRLYSQTVVVGCQEDGCKERCRKHFKPCKPVWDAEAFCRFHLDQAFERFPAGAMFLRHDDYEDSLSALIYHLVRMETTFDSERNDSFEGFAKTYLPKRAVDVGPRRVLGRNGNKLHNYVFAELDESNAGAGSFDSDSAEPGGHAHTGEGSGRGVQRTGDSAEVRAARLLGVGASRLAA